MDAGNNTQGLKLKTTVMRKLGDGIFSDDSFDKLMKVLDKENLVEVSWFEKGSFSWLQIIFEKFWPCSYRVESAEGSLDPAIKDGLFLKAICLT